MSDQDNLPPKAKPGEFRLAPAKVLAAGTANPDEAKEFIHDHLYEFALIYEQAWQKSANIMGFRNLKEAWDEGFNLHLSPIQGGICLTKAGEAPLDPEDECSRWKDEAEIEALKGKRIHLTQEEFEGSLALDLFMEVANQMMRLAQSRRDLFEQYAKRLGFKSLADLHAHGLSLQQDLQTDANGVPAGMDMVVNRKGEEA